ncbi:MAG: NAD(P)-binding domain-containing protein [Myxococcota bacterium]
MKIGFIGLGSMGGPQARLIARAGFELSVYDAFPEALDRFRGVARLADSAADAAKGAEIVGVCVRDDEQLEEAVFGAEGAAAALAPGALLLVHSTVRIDTLRSAAARLAARDVALVDAPVSRTRPTDDDPFVFSMLGGEPAQRARAIPLVRSFSTEVAEIGPLGAAMALKISNNLVSWVHIVAGGLAANLAKASGVPYGQLETVMRANGNLTPTVAGLLARFEREVPGTNADYEAFLASQAGIGEKDIALAIECVAAAGLDPALLEAARTQIRPTMTRKHG